MGCARRTVRSSSVIGVFDGLHLGHAYLLEHLVAEAADARRPADGHHLRPPPRRGPDGARRRRSCSTRASGSSGSRQPASRSPSSSTSTRRCGRRRTTRSSSASARGSALSGLPDDPRRGLRLRATRARRRRSPSSGARDGFDVVVVPPFDPRRPGRPQLRRSATAIAAGDLAAAARLLGRPVTITGRSAARSTDDAARLRPAGRAAARRRLRGQRRRRPRRCGSSAATPTCAAAPNASRHGRSLRRPASAAEDLRGGVRVLAPPAGSSSRRRLPGRFAGLVVALAAGLAAIVPRRGRRGYGAAPAPENSPDPRQATSGAGLPERLGDAALVVLVARHHEQRVGQAVEVGEDGRPDRSRRGPASVASRSARRQIVRATWSCAAPGDPPGSRKLVSGPTTSLSSSIRRSSSSMWRASTVGTGWRAWLVAGVARSDPRSNSSFWMRRSSAARRSHRPGRERDPDLRVELVDRAVGLDPRRILGDALAAAEPGHPFVAGLGVDPVESRHGSHCPARRTDRARRGRPRAPAFAASGSRLLPSVGHRNGRHHVTRRVRRNECRSRGKRSRRSSPGLPPRKVTPDRRKSRSRS